jgi:hypothetical protein
MIEELKKHNLKITDFKVTDVVNALVLFKNLKQG